MAEKINKALAKIIDEGIRHEGKHIVLPADPKKMTYREGYEALLEKAKEEEQVVHCHEIIHGNPWDALVSFHEALKAIYGWSTTKAKETFFGPIPPTMLDIRTGPEADDIMQVPVGVISAPGLDFSFEVAPDADGLHIMAELKKYQAGVVKEIVAKARVYLSKNSIYKGKAFRMPKRWSDQPQFESFKHAREEELVLNEKVSHAVLVNLFTPLEKTAKLKAAGIPVKNTVLLDGDYGTGKSMTMSIAAKKALAAGWTVIYLDNTDRLADALENAKRWQPCLLVAEDLDRVAGQRDDRLNQLINTLSGALSENADVMIVMTTNHADKIERVMLRRVDLITFERPNSSSVEKLIRLYARGKLAAGTTLDRISAKLEGQIPSTIKGVVELANKARIAFDTDEIDEVALIAAAHAKGPQIELLNSQKVEKEPSIDRAFKEYMNAAVVSGAAEAFARYLDINGNNGKASTLRKAITQEEKNATAVAN